MPLLAVGLGAVAAGTAMQVIGNKQAQKAIGGARAKEMAQQKELQRQAGTVFDESQVANSAPVANQTLTSGANARAVIANALKMSAAKDSTVLPMNQPDYQVTGGQPMGSALARTNTATNAWSNIVGGAANKLGSYNDLATKQGIGNQQTDAQMGVISNKARGDANLLPLEIEVASHRGDTLKGWGQIVSALGSVASMGAAAGIGSGAAATAGAAPGMTAAENGAWLAAQPVIPVGSSVAASQPSFWTTALQGGWGG